jgi:transposase, IS30 family
MAHHLTLQEREVVAQRRAAGCSQREIARQLGRDPATISRELHRNRSRNGYFASTAQQKADERRSNRPLTRKMRRPDVNRFVREALKKFLSPDQIAARAKLELRDRRRHVSRQTIYHWIHEQAEHGRQWQRYLRRHQPKRAGREKCGKIPNAASIKGRPKIAQRRGRRGDFEGDTVHGRPGRGGVLTLVDRKTRYTLIEPVADLQAETINEATRRALRRLPANHRHSFTLDNGKEFARHEELTRRTGMAVYFADPYCSWQRGTNENTNGLIRQFFPKGTDLAGVPAARIYQVQELLNHRPRRCLGYRTPHEQFTGTRTRCI